ncbi:hypothetical protein [Bacteroides faecalis]|uniref:hypothetical protein n=1 Tax=Bacteroides faecalis TaxID=2447885 RepID=UPI000F623CB4|nr:hypothetical protein [Bacteroides faecalis]
MRKDSNPDKTRVEECAYIVLALGKRFAEYETIGEMFWAERELSLTLTLWRRLLSCMKNCLHPYPSCWAQSLNKCFKVY